jgi:hypothetical protein
MGACRVRVWGCVRCAGNLARVTLGGEGGGTELMGVVVVVVVVVVGEEIVWGVR